MNLDIPKVMGILNVTPDSFYSDSRSFSENEIIARVQSFIAQGADIIDIGGCSTRPGFEEPTVEDEIARLDLGCRIVRQVSPSIPISIDTYRAFVADEIIRKWNCDIINDISGGIDPEMWNVVSAAKVAYVLTHNRRESEGSGSIVVEAIIQLSKKINELHRLGVCDVIIDPGFGFGKTLQENYQIFDQLGEFKKIGLPLLIGISRKSMIYKLLDKTPQDSLVGSVALNAIALEKGADILRVHDVEAAKDVVKIYTALKGS